MGNESKVACKWVMCVEETSQFNEDFVESYDEESDEGGFLKLMLNIQKNYVGSQRWTIFTRKNGTWES